MLLEHNLTLALMESATGGALGSALTDVDGASRYFKGGFVAYSEQAKIDLGVPAELLTMHGTISRETAEAMAKVARERFGADVGIGITGIAGGEEEEGQPPGTMNIALADGESVEYSHSRYYQGREVAKRRAVLQALTLLRSYLMIRSGARIE